MDPLHVTVPLSPSSVGSPNASPVQLYKNANTLGLGRCAICSHVFSAGQVFYECYLCLNSTCSAKACSPRRHKIEHEFSIIPVKLGSQQLIEVSPCSLCADQKSSSYFCDECDHSVCRDCWRHRDAAQSHKHKTYTVKDGVRSLITSSEDPKMAIEKDNWASASQEAPFEPLKDSESLLEVEEVSKDVPISSGDKLKDSLVSLLDDKEIAPPLVEESILPHIDQAETASLGILKSFQRRSHIDKVESIIPQEDVELRSSRRATKLPQEASDTPLKDSLSYGDDDNNNIASGFSSIEINESGDSGSFGPDASITESVARPLTISRLVPAPLNVRTVQRKPLAVSAVIPPATIDKLRASAITTFNPQPIRSLTSHPPIYAPAPKHPYLSRSNQQSSYPAPRYVSEPLQAPTSFQKGYVAAQYVQLPRNPHIAPVPTDFSPAMRPVFAPNAFVQPSCMQLGYSEMSNDHAPYNQMSRSNGA